MRHILAILSFFLLQSLQAQTPTANAGADQTIYLTSTNQVTLNGTASTGAGLSYAWREVSTDYSSGATITNANTATATVSGLQQGVFYFELQVTDNVDRVSVDTMAVIVDYAPAPANSTLLTHAIWSDMAHNANLRDDTTTCFSWSGDEHDLAGTDPNRFHMEKDGTLGSWIDSLRQKYYSVILDGHGCSGYGRSELIPTTASNDIIDTSKIYVIEWKGYFPELLSTPNEIIVIGQIHGNDGISPPFAYRPSGGNLIFSDLDASNTKTVICPLTELVNQTHTLRMTLKEGVAGTGFVKIELDGVQKYYRSTGQVGRTLGADWIKGCSIYDSYNTVIDATNTTRGKKFSLASESFKIYSLSDTTTVAAPTISMAGDQSITTSSTSTSGVVTWASGHSGTVQWSATSAPNTPTFSASTSESTGVSNLVTGTYVLRLTATQDDGQQAYGEVTITVIAASITNYFITHGKTIYINK